MAIKNAPVEIQPAAKAQSSADVRLSLIVSPELNETLEDLAFRSHTTKSEILRKAIALFDVASQAKQKEQRVGILDQEDKIVKEIVGI
jgi:predicted transcriptional regulator